MPERLLRAAMLILACGLVGYLAGALYGDLREGSIGAAVGALIAIGAVVYLDTI